MPQLLREIRQFIAISQSHDIARRYFVVNGFDGALTMLGLLMGFYFSEDTESGTIVTVCLSAAIALAMSGLSSAYVSEVAERKKEYRELQEAMVTDITGSAHEKAARWAPLVIAFTNGLSPLLISLVIISPFLLAPVGVVFPVGLFESSLGIAFSLIFFLGVFLGRVSGSFWLVAGLQTLGIALVTTLLIYLIT
ncbi:MAG: hypothetical protein OEY67_03635 [Gammaproteobacteria bacterium]|nr:hypothetical protein [Gammaproteobacteria bacterium]